MAAGDDLSAAVGSLADDRKAALCLGSDFWHTAPIPELGVEPLRLSDGPHGLRTPPDRGDHVGLSGSVPATCFPTAAALAASWDRELLREVGVALGVEARAQDVAVLLGPGINIKRSPLCGRNFEYFSEDPHLAGRLAAALVQGLQSQQVGASVKHFAANNQETDRLRISADVDERTLREIYLPAFEYVVTTARPWTVMCAYNKVNGVPASQHRWLLHDLLRGEWGFDGLVVSDWGAVHDPVAAVAAGLDLQMPPDLGSADRAITAAVSSGRLPRSALDAAATRVLALVQRARRRRPAAVDRRAHHELARRAAAAGIVLLKNDGGLLPLADAPGLSVAVIGELARTPQIQGAGSSQVNPTEVDVPLQELGAALPSAQVSFAAGYQLGGGPDPALAGEALRIAADADVVVVFLGLPPGAESEGYDRGDLDLPAVQADLVRQLARAAGTRLVVVLCTGAAVVTTGWDRQAAAVLECWLAGQGAGAALARVLTGAVNPSGRLAETIPRRLADCPSFLNFPGEQGHVRYGEGVFVGYRGYDAAGRPVAYPFGHGLSYTRFGYRDLRVAQSGSADAGDLAVAVTCTVTNLGQRAGSEVVQLYVGDPVASVARPPRELKGFTKLHLQPGEQRAVRFDLTARDLSFWSPAHQRWVLEPGEFRVAVGASSRDLRLQRRIAVRGQVPSLPLTGASTLAEWLADPVGGAALRAALTADGRPAGVLARPELLPVIGSFPLLRLTAFPGLGITRQLVEQLSAGAGGEA